MKRRSFTFSGWAHRPFRCTRTTTASWQLTYQWENLLGQDVLYSGPLFTHLFSHAWIDFRGIRDAFMREKGCDYFENTEARSPCTANIRRTQSAGFDGYSRDFWGITAGDGPGDRTCAKTAEIAASSATCLAARPMGQMTERSHHGRCWPHCLLHRMRLPARDIFSTLSRKYAITTGLRAGSIRPCRPCGGWLSEGWYGLDQGFS